ncbi:hypothetical protein SOHN41_00423 [Shewanella sp. HN-41]|nr:hypothetical protein SOHN41_00423 [Shewanella sp. HN-41]
MSDRFLSFCDLNPFRRFYRRIWMSQPRVHSEFIVFLGAFM